MQSYCEIPNHMQPNIQSRLFQKFIDTECLQFKLEKELSNNISQAKVENWSTHDLSHSIEKQNPFDPLSGKVLSPESLKYLELPIEGTKVRKKKKFKGTRQKKE